METPYGEIPDSYVPDMSPQDMHDYLKKRYSRRSIFKGAAVLGAASTPLFWMQSSASAATTTGPQWISYGTDPSSQMFISFSAGSYNGAAPAVPAAQVRYGLDSSYGLTSAATGGPVPIPAGYTQPSGDVDNTVYLHTELSGLQPGTTYHYSVSYDGINWGPDTTFTTAPAAPKDFRWVGTGDESTSNGSTLPIAQLIKSYSPEFTVVAGDLSYASGGVLLGAPGTTQPSYSPGAWDTYFSYIGPSVAQSTPWIVGVGNHEMEPLDQHGYAGFLARFPQPWDNSSGSPVTQTFTHGNVAFIGLDGNDLSAEISPNNGYTGGQQTTWLTNKLAAYRAAGSGIDFIVVYFHNCLYCSNQTHGSDDGLRHVWQPLFDQYQVDLVVNGHVHAYERSNPVRGTTIGHAPSGSTVNPATDGTTYICAGGGGQSLYSTWYGTTLAGDAGSATGPKINKWSGGETATGGTGSSSFVADTVTGFSAYRHAVWSFIVVDVVAPTTPGGTTTMTVQAIDPTQTAAGITSTSNPAIMDSVVLSRASTALTTPPNLPEVAKPALLVAGAGVALAGGVYAASRRDRLSGPSV
jgi:hypothetical protein